MSGVQVVSSPSPATLEEHESVIERGLQTFVDVGASLLAIRDGRLYRTVGYTRFEDYCRERWGWSRRRSYQLMDASGVVADLCTIVHTPATESQARELAPLRDRPEEMREAWQEALDRSDGAPTAKIVREVVRERTASIVECDRCHRLYDGSRWTDTGAGCPYCVNRTVAERDVEAGSGGDEWYTPSWLFEALGLRTLIRLGASRVARRSSLRAARDPSCRPTTAGL